MLIYLWTSSGWSKWEALAHWTLLSGKQFADTICHSHFFWDSILLRHSCGDYKNEVKSSSSCFVKMMVEWESDLYFPIMWVCTVPVLGLFSWLVKHFCTESRSQMGFSISILTAHPSCVWEIVTVANYLCHLVPKNIQWTSSNILSVNACNFFTMVKILEWYYELYENANSIFSLQL